MPGIIFVASVPYEKILHLCVVSEASANGMIFSRAVGGAFKSRDIALDGFRFHTLQTYRRASIKSITT